MGTILTLSAVFAAFVLAVYLLTRDADAPSVPGTEPLPGSGGDGGGGRDFPGTDYQVQ